MPTYELKLVVKDVEWKEFTAYCTLLARITDLLRAGSKSRRKQPSVDVIGFKVDGRKFTPKMVNERVSRLMKELSEGSK